MSETQLQRLFIELAEQHQTTALFQSFHDFENYGIVEDDPRLPP